jgi:hypothetical protein
MVTDPIRQRITLLLAEGFNKDDAGAWAEAPYLCSPADLLDLALWWRDGGFAAEEAIAWVDVLGPAGMLWAPRWTAGGYAPGQAAELLAAGIGVDEALEYWPAADHDRNRDRLSLLAALRRGAPGSVE